MLTPDQVVAIEFASLCVACITSAYLGIELYKMYLKWKKNEKIERSD